MKLVIGFHRRILEDPSKRQSTWIFQYEMEVTSKAEVDRHLRGIAFLGGIWINDTVFVPSGNFAEVYIK